MQNINNQRFRYALEQGNLIVLYGIIISTCLVTFWAWADKSGVRTARFCYDFIRIAQEREWYRLFTAGFLHSNMDHLSKNMIGIFVWGYFLCYRTQMSNTKFLLFYMSSIVFSHYFANQYYSLYYKEAYLVGASGALFAIKFASICLGFTLGHIPHIKKLRVLNIIFFLCFFEEVYSSFGTSHLDNIGHEVHFGGVLYGMLFALFYYPRLLFSGNDDGKKLH